MDYTDLYRKNHFKVGDVVFTLGEIPEHQLFLKAFAILTAWNPNNISTGELINAKSNETLEKDLCSMNLTFDKAIGYLEEHKEESYCVYDVNFEDAINLGRKFQQYSIFFHGNKTLGYYEVNTSKPILIRDSSNMKRDNGE